MAVLPINLPLLQPGLWHGGCFNDQQ